MGAQKPIWCTCIASGLLAILPLAPLWPLPAALHDLDPVFRSFSRSAKVAELLRDLGYQRPLAMQSMYITKQVGGRELGKLGLSLALVMP
jgi:hypothetical protein